MKQIDLCEIAERLKTSRKARHLTQEQVADALGFYGNGPVSRIERAEKGSGIDNLCRLHDYAEFYGVDLKWLIFGSDSDIEDILYAHISMSKSPDWEQIEYKVDDITFTIRQIDGKELDEDISKISVVVTKGQEIWGYLYAYSVYIELCDRKTGWMLDEYSAAAAGCYFRAQNILREMMPTGIDQEKFPFQIIDLCYEEDFEWTMQKILLVDEIYVEQDFRRRHVASTMIRVLSIYWGELGNIFWNLDTVLDEIDSADVQIAINIMLANRCGLVCVDGMAYHISDSLMKAVELMCGK